MYEYFRTVQPCQPRQPCDRLIDKHRLKTFPVLNRTRNVTARQSVPKQRLHFTFPGIPFVTLAVLSCHSRLWAGTHRGTFQAIRSIMTTSNEGTATKPPMASSSETTTQEQNASISPGLPKKLHGRAFYESIGSPKFILAPMVDQSEFVRLCPPIQASPHTQTLYRHGECSPAPS